MNGDSRRITYNILLKALRRAMGKKIEEDALKRITEYVLNLFGYETYYPDYRLNQEERNLFYMLEDQGLVTAHEETFAFPNGGSIRVGFWTLKVRRIIGLATEACEEAVEDPVECIYDTIEEDIWAEHASHAVPGDA